MEGPPQYIARAREQQEHQRKDPYALMFDKQRQAFLSPPTRFVAVHSGRRAGKTAGFLSLALGVMRKNPGCRIPYVALTRKSAEGIVWNAIKMVNEKYELGLEERKGDLTWRDPVSGSEVYLVGANKSDEVEKLRGQPFPLVGIDEASSFRGSLLEYLVREVLTWALMDMRGMLVLVGTPGAACVGYFHEVCTGVRPGWSVYHWDARDNPYVDDAQGFFDELCELHGWDPQDAAFQREALGLFVQDTSALVYKWLRSRNGIDAMPDDYDPASKAWSHVLAMDYGYVDSCAWVVLAFRSWKNSRGDKNVYIPESFKRSTLLPSEYMEMCNELTALGHPVELDRPEGAGLLPDECSWLTKRLVNKYRPGKIVGDGGGLGKPYVEHARRRHGINVKPADKQEKLAQIELVNGALRTSALRVMLSNNRDLIGEAEILQWDMEKVAVTAGGLVRHELRRVIDSRFEDHLCDALQYGYGAVTAYRNEAPAKTPPRDLSRDRVDEIHDAPKSHRQEAGWLETERTSRQAKDWWDR